MVTMSVMENRSEAGRLHLDDRKLKQLAPLHASVIDISSRFADEREKVEAFITGVYRDAYGATISVSYPTLMSVRDDQGRILAATGFRYAGEEALFLEHYTNASIDRVLSDRYRQEIERQEIVEIGNLASGGGGASIFLFAALSAYLDARGIRYATITGTNQLQKRFRALGLKPKFICDADPAVLPPSEQDRWGSYYETQPRVLAGSVDEGVCHLHKALGAVYEESGASLFPRLHFRPCQ